MPGVTQSCLEKPVSPQRAQRTTEETQEIVLDSSVVLCALCGEYSFHSQRIELDPSRPVQLPVTDAFFDGAGDEVAVS